MQAGKTVKMYLEAGRLANYFNEPLPTRSGAAQGTTILMCSDREEIPLAP